MCDALQQNRAQVAQESTPLNKPAVADDARAYMPVDGLNMTLCQMKSCKSVENKCFDQKFDINHYI